MPFIARACCCIGLAIIITACSGDKAGNNPLPSGDARKPSATAPATKAANQAVSKQLPLDDAQDFSDARRGFIATRTPLVITREDGSVVWSDKDYAWQNDKSAPDSVNPSLWRQAQLNNIHGLFKVKEGIYQVRGFDLANMTLIEGSNGWIVVDPLTAVETAEAALKLANDTLGKRPVTAVLYTHSHIDHFAGAAAVVSQADADSGAVPVVAPAHFTREAVSENVIAGAVMTRRASYMYGMTLPRTATGHVDTGLGKQPGQGTTSLIKPNTVVNRTGQTLTIDGVEFVFQYTPESEAPAEFMFFLPQYAAFCGAEVLSRNFHNIYTLRGAKVRDALKWAGYIDEALVRFGSQTEIVFNSHHWPVFGNDAVRDYIKKQRDIYRYTHDQTLRLASQGLTPNEIAASITLPESLRNNFATRGYYGTLKHNAKAVYQHYFGWYDGNPVNLDPLPPEAEANRYVEAMGGIDAVVEKARNAYTSGDFQWAAQLAHHAVFADASHQDARIMLAQAYEQLGYQAESGPWRDVYLSGANELRNGLQGVDMRESAGALLRSVPLDLFFVAMATNVDPESAAGKVVTVNFRFTDTGDDFTLMLENSVLNHRQGLAAEADATLTLTQELLVRLISGQASLKDLVGKDGVSVEGSFIRLGQLLGSLGLPNFDPFPMTTP